MKKFSLAVISLLLINSAYAGKAFLGYLSPSGGQRGSTVRIIAGGQNLYGKIQLLTATPGITLKSAVLIPNFGYFHTPQKKFLTQWLKNIYAGNPEKPPYPPEKEQDEKSWRKSKWLENLDSLPMLERSIIANSIFVRANPLQAAPSIAQKLLLELEISPDAPTGPCKIRVVAGKNISNEKLFFIDPHRQIQEVPYYPPFAQRPENEEVKTFPVTLNGQIMPGENDIFPVYLEAGKNYTFRMRAAELSPYLGDAVPGHFQGILSLRGDDGKEVAFADDEYHHPDPVLRFTPQKTGRYTLIVSDSIKRGRADFVYRVTVTEKEEDFEPYRNFAGNFNIFPTLPEKEVPEIITKDIWEKGLTIDGKISNTDPKKFIIKAAKGDRVIFETFAARIDSPLDTVLTLYDKTGSIIAENDDNPQKIDLDICRRQTDSKLDVTFKAPGIYYLTVSDRTPAYGENYIFKLQIHPPMPGAEVISGSSVLEFNAQRVAKMKFYALRKDGFNGEITISSPQLTPVGKAVIPEGSDSAEITFRMAEPPRKNQVMELTFSAGYTVNDRQMTGIPVTPADEAMQAFAYTHLLVADKFYCYPVRIPAPPKKRKP